MIPAIGSATAAAESRFADSGNNVNKPVGPH